MDATVAAWSHYRRFCEERDALAGAPWERARLELHKIEDFVAGWGAAAKGMPESGVKLTLLREVASYGTCAPAWLRALR